MAVHIDGRYRCIDVCIVHGISPPSENQTLWRSCCDPLGSSTKDH